MSGPPGWHASPAQPVPPDAAGAGSLHKHTEAAGAELCQGRIWPCRAKQLSAVPPALSARSSPTSPVPVSHLLPASFPPAKPCVTILSCLVLWRRRGLQLQSPGRSLCLLLSLSSPAGRLIEMLGLAGLLRAGCICPPQAVMGKSPGNF